ncbi:Mucin-2 [Streptomyces bambusae]|uniref:Mucin-2 n=1 Tax=Streptomyces bambusae TaxID=1550616 RepID=UPI001CFD0F9C|nr:Mucin-2 [Streptomyces bambusae]MCB5166466.1 Mucin-2 [Streptomyces bambusae]
MVAFYSSALDGIGANPALPAPLLLRLVAFDDAGGGPPFQVLHRPGLPEAAVAVVIAHPSRDARVNFASSGQAEPEQRARLADDPAPEVRAAVAHGPEFTHDRRRTVRPLPDAVCRRLLDDPEPSVRDALLYSPYLSASFRASLADHPDPAARRTALHVWDELPPAARTALLADPDPDVRRSAALCACPGDARLTARLLDDPAALPEALRRGLLDRAEAERRLTAGIHLDALAANPALPADLVDRLAADRDDAVRMAVSLRPELSPARRAAIDVTVAPWARVAVDWVDAGLADQDVLRRAVTSGHPLLRRAAACSPHLPPDLLRLLAADPDDVVRTHLAIHHPDTPEEVLMSVYARLGGTFSAWMATGHPRFPREGLAARFADHPEAIYRQLAVRDPAASPALIERLSHDPDVHTRQAACADPRLPLPRLLDALTTPELARTAGANPALPHGDMARVMDEAGVPT